MPIPWKNLSQAKKNKWPKKVRLGKEYFLRKIEQVHFESVSIE